METPPNVMESLVEKIQQYSRTSIELYRLKAINKSADMIATLVSKTCFCAFFRFVLLDSEYWHCFMDRRTNGENIFRIFHCGRILCNCRYPAVYSQRQMG